MCGIIGYISLYNCCNYILLNGLKQLQNRGYDSAGITSIDTSGNITTTKYASQENKDSLEIIEQHIHCHTTNIGIGHTRWATHGGKTNENSHPHICMHNIFTIVHNGIIENYSSLKRMLIDKKFIFKSQTDTEVISNLLLYTYNNYNTNNNTQNNQNISIEEIINETCMMLEGTWALVIMCSVTPNKLYTTRRGSPLLISCNKTDAYIVSEQSAFCGKTKDYFTLKSNDIVTIEIQNNEITSKSFNNSNIRLSNTTKTIFTTNELSFNPYSCWLEKEIYEQVDSSSRAISLGGRLLSNKQVKLGGLECFSDVLKNTEHIILLGCGTSYHACLLGVDYFRKNANFVSVQCIDGAEFDDSYISNTGKTSIILLSQSGETRDLYRCIKVGKQNNCTLVGVVNVVDSQIARKVDCGVYLNAGREVSVASTKSFTSQSIILQLMSIWFSQIQNNIHTHDVFDDLRNFSYHIHDFLQNNEKNKINDWAKYFKDFNSCFLIGKGNTIPITYEGALKIKEITYIHAEGYSASGLKHGPLALIETGFPVILFITDDDNVCKMISAYEELYARGAKLFCISNSVQFFTYISERDEYDNNCLISLKYETENINLLMNICTQLLAYNICIEKGLDPDKPRNLAKVVTVE